MNLINKTFADLPNEENLDLSWMCKIKEWIIEKINVKESIWCWKDLYIYVKSSNWYFILKNQTALIWECVWGSYIQIEELPKEWQKIDILTKNISLYEGYWYMWTEKNKKWDLIFFGKELGYIPENCTPNSNFIEFHKDYFYFWTWIIILIILWIFLYKKFKK